VERAAPRVAVADPAARTDGAVSGTGKRAGGTGGDGRVHAEVAEPEGRAPAAGDAGEDLDRPPGVRGTGAGDEALPVPGGGAQASSGGGAQASSGGDAEAGSGGDAEAGSGGDAQDTPPFELTPAERQRARARHQNHHQLMLAKLVPEPLSEVPHDVRVAWDDAPDYNTPGYRVVFELEVDPNLSDAQIEQLVSDVRNAHPDAGHLTVKVREPTDPGTGRPGALIALSRRSEDRGIDSFRILP
jgi:hypothetical protein